MFLLYIQSRSMHQLVGQNVETVPIDIEVQNCNNKMATYATLNTCDLKEVFFCILAVTWTGRLSEFPQHLHDMVILRPSSCPCLLLMVLPLKPVSMLIIYQWYYLLYLLRKGISFCLLEHCFQCLIIILWWQVLATICEELSQDSILLIYISASGLFLV
jgi:hypothetical protein